MKKKEGFSLLFFFGKQRKIDGNRQFIQIKISAGLRRKKKNKNEKERETEGEISKKIV